MRKRQPWFLLVSSSVMLVSAAWAAEPIQGLLDGLYRRFQPSRIETQSPERQGAVTRQGKVLILALDHVPAKPFRVVRTDPRSPAVHVMDFALVEIEAEGAVATHPGPLALNAGTRLMLMDLQVHGDRVHLFAHTVDPISGDAGRAPVYGCTEFVFRLAPHELRAGALGPIAERIERSLTWTPIDRVCAPNDTQLCLEP